MRGGNPHPSSLKRLRSPSTCSPKLSSCPSEVVTSIIALRPSDVRRASAPSIVPRRRPRPEREATDQKRRGPCVRMTRCRRGVPLFRETNLTQIQITADRILWPHRADIEANAEGELRLTPA